MSLELTYPPAHAPFLLTDYLQFHLDHNPSFPAFVYPNEDGTLTHISFLEFVRAAHRAAHAVRPNRTGADGEVVAIIANTDSLLYQAIISGITIAGLVPFPMSPRNSSAAVVSMLQKTACNRLLTLPSAHQSLVSGIKRELGTPSLHVQVIPTLAEVFPHLGKEQAHDTFERYPSAGRPSLDEAAVYIHSSGSTGFPKPIPQTYRSQMHWLQQPAIQGFAGYTPAIRLAAASLPPFHSLGNCVQLYSPLASVVTAALFPPTSFDDPDAQPVIPTSDNILDNIRKTGANCVVAVPSFLELWAGDDEAIETLKQMVFVIYGGGPLSSRAGDKLHAAGVPVASVYGATEFGSIMNLPSREDLKSGDWEWMHPSSKVKMRWVLQDDGTYECQVLTTAEHQVAVENLPDVKGYATSDLFIKHPTREGYWKIVGRKDDVLILASGEKTVPAPMESVIISNPLVSGVVMFGRARSQVGVLVEAISDVDVTDTKAVEEFRNKVWPDVEAANKDAPAFSRIFKEMILITSPSKPMVRVAKGTVSKKATIKAYEEEINALYNTVEASTKAGSDATPPRSWTEPALIEWLQEQIASISSGVDIIPDKDFFSQGFDSLNATFLRNRILGALYASDQVELRTAAKRIPQNFVFDNPSIHLLAKRVASIVNRPEGETNGSTAHDKKMAIENALKKYSIGLGKTIMTNGAHAENQGEIPSKGSVVLLTGSTGGLGSYLLALLLKNEATAKVYAFNRPSKADAIKGRQASSFEDRALDVTLLDSEKLVFLEGDAAADKCGLDERTYNELRESVTIIIHNAWRLDFNLALSSFEPNIQGTRQLIDLALSSSHPSNPRFLFTSSIASAQGWDQRKGAFPEEVQLDASVAVGSGYGESKYISERLLDMSGLHATSFRIGQIAGGPNGAWSTTDWVPIIAKSSLALAVFPAAQGLVSWMPAEKVAAAILDVAFAEQTPPLALNLAHPRPVSWMDTMEILRDTLLEKKCLHRKDFPFVDFGEWVKRLEKRAQNATAVDFDNIPALKLLDFFRTMADADMKVRQSGRTDVEAGGIATLSTDKAQSVSSTWKNLPQIGKTDAELWVEYWLAKGAF